MKALCPVPNTDSKRKFYLKECVKINNKKDKPFQNKDRDPNKYMKSCSTSLALGKCKSEPWWGHASYFLFLLLSFSFPFFVCMCVHVSCLSPSPQTLLTAGTVSHSCSSSSSSHLPPRALLSQVVIALPRLKCAADSVLFPQGLRSLDSNTVLGTDQEVPV